MALGNLSNLGEWKTNSLCFGVHAYIYIHLVSASLTAWNHLTWIQRKIPSCNEGNIMSVHEKDAFLLFVGYSFAQLIDVSQWNWVIF